MQNGEVPMATTLMPEPRIRTADLLERSGGGGGAALSEKALGGRGNTPAVMLLFRRTKPDKSP